ncbi:hypothetical protein QFC21_005191 [Naganishia friedmannii]|uniref:Uncharacterized protein n=1 Tax=Naganishia friedmannii TaxID=89922 RepID=A0ACC2VAJ5_9TREE|nr:hypothetical protein QFC21_005191 [Naganishia friedmannii]
MASVPPQSHNAKRKASQGSSLLGQERGVGTQANNRKGNTSRIKRPSQENANRREQSVINKENKPTPKQYKSELLNQIPTLGSPFVQQFDTSSLGANSFHSLQSAKTAEASPISDAGYSLAESTSARSGCTCTTNMSDLVINTGFENDYLNGVSLLQVSSLAEQRKPGSAVL